MSAATLMPAVALAAVAAVSALAAYWFFVLRRMLPLDRRLRESRERAEDLKRFSLEIMDLDPSAQTVALALNELGHRVLSSLHSRMPSLVLAWIRRQEGGSGVLAAHKGAVWAKLGLESLRFDTPLFLEALGEGRLERDLLAPPAEPPPLLRSLADHGLSRLALVPWGKPSGSSGLLAVADPDPGGRGLEEAGPFLELAGRLATLLSAVVDDIQSLAQARERLQGGLSAAMAELNQTQSRLIQKSREIRTLHEVANTLTSRDSETRTTLSAIVSIVARYLEADLVAFLLLDESAGELVTQPGAYGLEGSEMLYRIPLSQEGSSSVRVFKTGEPFVTGDAQNDPRVIAQYVKLWKIHSLMVVPVKSEGHPIGVIRVGSFKRGSFTPEHLDLVTVIAEEASVFVETALLNRRLSETAEQLKALNRMKDDFVSTVSHEFKTPLTTLMGFITILLSGETGPLSEQQSRFLTVAQNAVNRLTQLVTELLDLSKLEAGARMDMKALPLEPLVRSSVEAHEPAASKAGKLLTADIPKRLPKVWGDPRWLTLVVDNLLSNALKFTRPGGRIRVSVADKGGLLLVCVQDDGIGIPREDREHIFEKFYRARNHAEANAPGTGLGLAITREIVLKHGGKIWFESEPGQGTKFYFVISAARAGEANLA